MNIGGGAFNKGINFSSEKYTVLKIFFKFGYWRRKALFTGEPADIQINASTEAFKKRIELEITA